LAVTKIFRLFPFNYGCYKLNSWDVCIILSHPRIQLLNITISHWVIKYPNGLDSNCFGSARMFPIKKLRRRHNKQFNNVVCIRNSPCSKETENGWALNKLNRSQNAKIRRLLQLNRPQRWLKRTAVKRDLLQTSSKMYLLW